MQTPPLVTYAVLLRGINVGGHTPVSMLTLKSCLTQLGYKNVQTYINSGNVVFQSHPTDLRAIETKIEQALLATFSQPITVVAHTLAQMQEIIAHIPHSWLTTTDQKCNVVFLRHTIDHPDILQNFHPKPDIEELHYTPGVLFWSAKTSDLTKSAMLKISRLPLYADMTIRGLATTRKLLQLMRQTDQA